MSTEKLYNILTIQSKIQCYANRITIKKDINKLKKSCIYFIGERRELFKEIERELERYDFFKVKCFTN